MERSNMDAGPSMKTEWTSGDQRKGIQAIYSQVDEIAEKAMDWYMMAMPDNRRRARWIRMWTIIAATVAGILPTVSVILENYDITCFKISPGFTTIVLALAAMLLAIDNFFGYSNSWIRFTQTGLQVRQALQNFRIEWQSMVVTWKNGEPDVNEVQVALGKCKEFLAKVNTMVAEETKTWAEEFAKALKQIDDSVKDAPKAHALGALNLTITNGAASKQGWELFIDNQEAQPGSGNAAARRNLQPGLHVVKVTGKIDEKEVSAEKAFVVAPGEAIEVTVTLA